MVGDQRNKVGGAPKNMGCPKKNEGGGFNKNRWSTKLRSQKNKVGGVKILELNPVRSQTVQLVRHKESVDALIQFEFSWFIFDIYLILGKKLL